MPMAGLWRHTMAVIEAAKHSAERGESVMVNE